MIVDCDRCEVRGDACGDCVITVLLGSAPGQVRSDDNVRFDDAEQRAIDALAGAGLVPRLRLVPNAFPDQFPDQERRTSRTTPDVAGRGRGGAKRSAREAG
jgi:hypothetical protein